MFIYNAIMYIYVSMNDTPMNQCAVGTLVHITLNTMA